MRVFRSIRAVSSWRRRQRDTPNGIGFVATMGALHEGHTALIQRARRSCRQVVVSIFVNPSQFGAGEDYSQYPRTLSRDLAICRKAGVAVVFAPHEQAMYPHGFQTSVEVHDLSRRWEGEVRPTHFRGVATVVTKLLNLIRPQTTFFGQKDYQQTLVVRRLVQDLNLGVHVVMCPTIREADGLALSSRNAYLSPSQRRAAPLLYAALQAGRDDVRAGFRSADRIQATMAAHLGRAPRIQVDYLAVCDAETLEPLMKITGRSVLLGAIRVDNIRLIDNVLVT